MPRLQVLPPNLANMIAAGEVVQRPASVVKELMENSVDAGASTVKVIILDSGRTLVQVIDDGCGMSSSDAKLCFERHATSKISTPEDLNNILSYGFRGEALASIAAVSEVTLKTRREEDEVGTQVTISSFDTIEITKALTAVGCNFAIRNIFYNVPARRKFLKSDVVEFKHILEEFTRVALTHHQIGFTLAHNGKDVAVLKPAKSLKFRIQDLLGSSVVGELVDIDTTTSIARVTGFVGRPDSARKTLGNQYLFVNGRFFRSPYIHKAVMKAYEGFIPEGVTPSYFIYLEVDPHSIDVNIHPTKTEIKFEDDSVFFQLIYACVREVLGKNSFGADIDFEAESAIHLPVFSQSSRESQPVDVPKVKVDTTYNPFDFGNSAIHFERETPQDYGKLFEERPAISNSQATILQGKYIAVPASSGMMLINVYRAQERILFDRFLSAVSQNRHVVQTALFPVQVKVGTENRLIFDENAELLENLGFDISPFGNDTIVVNGVPEGFSCEEGKMEKMVDDLLLILSEDYSSLESSMAEEIAAKLSKIGSSSARAITSAQDAQRLVDKLLSCTNAEFTASGKRIISILSVDEIDKRF